MGLFTQPDFLDYTIGDKYPQFFAINEKFRRQPCEMTHFENAFLMGLIKKYTPQKILEVGVASGATTTMILDAIAQNSPKTELWSCDLSPKLYWGDDLKTGYLALKKYNNAYNWHFISGDFLPTILRNNPSMRDFDCCILDTVHSLPGEILDFLSVLPFLKDNTILIMHDIQLPFNFPNAERAISNKILLDSIVADKIYVEDMQQESTFANIGAAIINQETRRHINNVFSSLALPWAYIPSKTQIDLYSKHYGNLYGQDYETYLQNIYKNQIRLFKQHANNLFTKHLQAIKYTISSVKQRNKKTALWGMGVIGSQLLKLFKEYSLPIDYAIDKDVTKQGMNIEGCMIISPDSIDEQTGLIFVTAKSILTDTLIERNSHNVYFALF